MGEEVNAECIFMKDEKDSTVSHRLKLKNLHISPRPKWKAIGVYIFISMFITITISVVTIFSLKTSKRKDESTVIGLKTSDDLWFYNLNTGNLNSKNVTIPSTSFDVINTDVIWSDVQESMIKSTSSMYDNIAIPKKLTPHAIAVDALNDKIYIIDKSLRTLTVTDINSHYSAIIFSGLQNPQDLIFDPEVRLIFISLEGRSILRSDANGSNLMIFEARDVTAIAADFANRRIYWAKHYHSIESVNYEGEERSTIVRKQSVFTSLEFSNNRLFWLISGSGMHRDAVLQSCEIVNSTCHRFTFHDISLSKLTMIKSTRSIIDSHYSLNNPCKINNGDCDHLCILNGDRSHSCACKIGFELKASKFCLEIVDYMLYIDGNLIMSHTLDGAGKDAFVDVFLPIKFSVYRLEKRKYVLYDYYLQKNEIYLADDYYVYSVHMLNNVEIQKIYEYDGYSILDIAIDWVSGYLYIINLYNNNDMYYIDCIDTNQNYIFKFFPVQLDAQSLTFHPDRKFFFCTVSKGMSYSNIRSLDSTQLSDDMSFRLSYYNDNKLLSLDYEENVLYFVSDLNACEISTLNIDTFQNTSQFTLHFTSPRSIYVYKDDFYISNSSHIFRYPKKTGDRPTQIVPKSQQKATLLSNVKIVSPSIQKH